MKKILAIMASVILTIMVFAGCAGNSNSPTVLSNKPWDNNNGYEFISYRIDKTTVVRDDDGTLNAGETEAAGELTYALTVITGNIYNSDEYANLLSESEYFASNFQRSANNLQKTPGAYTLLVSSFSLTYERGTYTGKTDTMTSAVLFKSASLEPVFSEKTVVNGSNGISYTATADYSAKKNIFTHAGETAETEILGTYDNEMLAYVIRGRNALTSGRSEALSFNNAVYSGVYNRQEARSITASVNSSVFYVNGIDKDKTGFVSNYFTPDSIDYYEDTTMDEEKMMEFPKGYSLKAYAVTAALSSSNSGSPIVLYYSVPSFSSLGQITSNVLLQMTSYEYDSETGNISYMFNYKIDDYKTSKHQ